MLDNFINIGLGFLEGFGLIISPCILPILPIMLAGSLIGSKKRPVGIVIGFVVSFVAFTLFARKLIQLTGIDSAVIRPTTLVLLFILGIIMLSSTLSDKLTALTAQIENVGSAIPFINNLQSGFWSGLFFGTLVALIWTPCAGPILAAIIVQTVMQHTNMMSFWVLLAFTIGAAAPMFAIAVFGRKIMSKMSFFKSRAIFLRKILGAIITLAVAYMAYSDGFIATSMAAGTSYSATELQGGLAIPYPAPALADIASWINTSPLQLNKLKGKVVLIDFWTYTCPHCLNTISYINEWHDQYHDKGLVIIGIHGPSYSEQTSIANVKNAVTRLNIRFPIALDNRFATWENYGVSFWPTFYLINKEGEVVYQHRGEGDYDIIENNIKFLLGM